MAKKRGKKTNISQMEALVDYLNSNRILISGKLTPANTDEVENKWGELVEQLNIVPNGARKNVKQWKNFYAQWKSAVRKRARQSRKFMMRTGGGGYTCSSLSKLQNRLMGVVGWVSVMNCSDMPLEVGSDEPTSHMSPDILNSENIENNDNKFTIEMLDDESQNEVAVGVSPTQLPYVPIKKEKTKKKQQYKFPVQDQLAKSAELYTTSADKLALSINNIAGSINALATAFTNIANALEHSV